MGALAKITDKIADQVLKDIGKTPKQKAVKETTLNVVLTKLHDVGRESEGALKESQDLEIEEWKRSNPDVPADFTSSSYMAMMNRHRVARNQIHQIWGRPIEPPFEKPKLRKPKKAKKPKVAAVAAP